MFNHIYSRYQDDPMDTVQRAIGGMFISVGSTILMSPFFIPVSLPVFFLGLCLLLSGPAYLLGEDIYKNFQRSPNVVAVLSVVALAGLSILALPLVMSIPLDVEILGLLMATIAPYLCTAKAITQSSRSGSSFSRYDSDYYPYNTGDTPDHQDSNSHHWQDAHVTYY